MASSKTSPAWSKDDRSLLLALELYEATLCPGCGQPKDLAWHSWSHSAWETLKMVCHPCTTNQGHEVWYTLLTRGPDAKETKSWPPFKMGETTTTPEDPKTGG